MSAITRSLNSDSSHLRPFNVREDLNAVADLVETCFADTLDEDGRRYVNHMHAAARNPSYLRWAMSIADNTPMPFSGFVWEENGYLAGNLNLIPYKYQGKRCYLIANVAVDPAYRRRGIARDLTAAAIEHAHKRGAVEIWLHVREENEAARNLYQSFGFVNRALRTTWEVKPGSTQRFQSPAVLHATGIEIAPPKAKHWPQYQHWLQELYPPQLTWHQAFNPASLRPSLLGSITRFLTANQVRQWAALEGEQLLGILAWQPRTRRADHLWLATSPENERSTIAALFPFALRKLSHRRRMLLEYPADRAILPLHEAGFNLQQTLVWMRLE
jgi:ribosomal protein S18 acetylase RimI-like enzyme